MIRPAELRAIRAGTVDLAFRRWERPRVKVGTRMRTSVGLVEVVALDVVDAGALTTHDSQRAGTDLDSLSALLARPGDADRPVYRIGLRYAGPDPRIALRDSVPDDAERGRIEAALDRLDRAAQGGAWTRPTLTLIAQNPGVRAPDLAARLKRPTAEFKIDVRKLKELGLTESLDIGYRISRRGLAVLGEDPAQAHGPRHPLPRVGASAARALRAAGLEDLDGVASAGRQHVAALPGLGPVGLARLDEALEDAGLTWA